MNDPARRDFLRALAPAAAITAAQRALGAQSPPAQTGSGRPNVLFLMADQFRFDAIRSLGNSNLYTPNLDRLVSRGVTFINAYSQCPVCVPSRYTVRTGCEAATTRIFANGAPKPLAGQAPAMTGRCGPYLADTMKRLGYRTFGIGKFHTIPWDEKLGYDVHLHSEPQYGTADQRRRDAYAAWLKKEHPAYDFLEEPMGERTEMYYMPQMSPLPAEVAVERWTADRAVEQIAARGDQPYFGLVSFVGPHPPFAPPLPFNRLYDPDRMPNPVRGERELDHMDEQIPWMNYGVWAEDINDSHARVLKARYYGEITYIDDCIGRILMAVEARGDGGNTLICFFSDHGDLLGDHHGWQKENYFEASTRIPFLVSWPDRIAAAGRRDDLVALVDLFGIATSAAGAADLRQGIDVLGSIAGTAARREHLAGYYGEPATPRFKIMVRGGEWKYIFLANGGGEQLFDIREDPNELRNRATTDRKIARKLRQLAVQACDKPELRAALDGAGLREFPFKGRPLRRIYQFDRSRGVTGFPNEPEDVLANWKS